ncbi:MAG TPA: biotin--[acetyl-CoA-carboxylase] ligase [Panacibacter sp.]|nr:biotin--[acetyl-CoA-carboxylase] ligase [Panacibacter sp.]
MPATSTNHSLGIPFIEIFSVESTNNYAMQLVQEGFAGHGAACYAYEQTAGKGQRGKAWHAQAGENITISVVFNTNSLQVSTQFAFNMTIALGVCDFLRIYTAGDTFIKWPNDLYWRDRKAGGILIENIIRGKEWQWAVAGIGINVNQTLFDTTLTNPVSLKQITGKEHNPVLLAKELCKSLEYRYNQLLSSGAPSILEDYNGVLYKRGNQIKLKKDNAVFECILKGVDIFGKLLVVRNLEESFNTGEVEWVFN